MSYRNVKENIEPIDEVEVLERLTELPISRWNYKTEGEEIRHIGPMAQDFRQAFALGQDTNFITTIDLDGVALAAIQGLHKLVQQNDAKVAVLTKRIETLEELVRSLVPMSDAPPAPLDAPLSTHPNSL